MDEVKLSREDIALHILNGMIALGGVNRHLDGLGDAENNVACAFAYADVFIKVRDSVD